MKKSIEFNLSNLRASRLFSMIRAKKRSIAANGIYKCLGDLKKKSHWLAIKYQEFS